MAYIHYGSPQFAVERFYRPRNIRGWNKPNGGLWASDESAEYGWKKWCEIEKFRECLRSNSFRFELAPTANILLLDSKDAVGRLPEQNLSKSTSTDMRSFRKCSYVLQVPSNGAYRIWD